MIAIIDYGAGNLHSVQNALNYLKADHLLVSSSQDLKNVDKIILPGVGHFGQASKKLENSGCYQALLDWLTQDKPFLGICVGLQLLMQGSSEAPNAKGFGIFSGQCKKFTCQKVPQMGWNQITYQRQDPLFQKIPSGSNFYFVHSYYPQADNQADILASCQYDISFGAVLQKGNIYGTQFHPEKSGKSGLQLLKNWIEL